MMAMIWIAVMVVIEVGVSGRSSGGVAEDW